MWVMLGICGVFMSSMSGREEVNWLRVGAWFPSFDGNFLAGVTLPKSMIKFLGLSGISFAFVACSFVGGSFWIVVFTVGGCSCAGVLEFVAI